MGRVRLDCPERAGQDAEVLPYELPKQQRGEEGAKGVPDERRLETCATRSLLEAGDELEDGVGGAGEAFVAEVGVDQHVLL